MRHTLRLINEGGVSTSLGRYTVSLFERDYIVFFAGLIVGFDNRNVFYRVAAAVVYFYKQNNRMLAHQHIFA